MNKILNIDKQKLINVIFTNQDIFGRNLGFINQSGLVPADLLALIEFYLPYLILEE